MSNKIIHIGFRLIAFFVRKANQHKLEYYRYMFDKKLIIGRNIRFKRNSSIVFLDNNSDANLSLGDNCEFRQYCILTLFGPASIKIGNDCFFNNNCSINSLGKITIGENCLFGEGVKIYDHNHKYKDKISIREQGFTVGEVVIGNNCWFGSNCTILNNVTIGDNVVVGANTLIHKSIESNSIVRNTQSTIASFYN